MTEIVDICRKSETKALEFIFARLRAPIVSVVCETLLHHLDHRLILKDDTPEMVLDRVRCVIQQISDQPTTQDLS